jgi:hypothetical protein
MKLKIPVRLGPKRKEFWENCSLSMKSTKRNLMKLMTLTSINWMILGKKKCKKLVRKKKVKR